MTRNIELRIVNYVLADQVGLSNNVGGTYSIYDVGLVANYQSLDLLENENINITIQNQDINDYSKIKVNFSKTFNIPATPKNNRYLIDPGNISKLYSVTDDLVLVDNVDIYNYPIAAQICVDGDLILEGQLNIKSVNRNTTPNMIECIFTTDIKSIIPLLKQQSFSAEYFRKPVTSVEFGSPQLKLIPANFIWDSILFENYIHTESPNFLSKNQLLPVGVTPSFYPRYIRQDLPDYSNKYNFLNHIISSWTQSNSKFYWGLIDDGTRPYVNTETNEFLRTNQAVDKTHKIPSQLQLSANYFDLGPLETNRTFRISSMLSYQPFKDFRPYYYVSDIFEKVFRWLEYKLNGEYYNYTTLQNSFPQYTNYDRPGFTYSNTPIRFSLDTNILGTGSNPNLNDYVFIHSENDFYKNSSIDMSIQTKITVTSGNVDLVEFIAYASIIKNALNLSPTASNWDQYGITYIKVDYQAYSGNGTVRINNTIQFDGVRIDLPSALIPIALTSTPFYYTLGIGTYLSLPASVRDNFPPGHTSSTYIDLTTIPGFDADKWIYYYINANNLAFNLNGSPTTSGSTKDVNYVLTGYPATRIFALNFPGSTIVSATFGFAAYVEQDLSLYDLRRYVYPQLEGYSMGDFIQDILKTFNVKIEEPFAQNPDGRIQMKTFNKYIEDCINKYGIKDLSGMISADKMKINKTQYGLLNLKNQEQEGDLVETFFLSDVDKTGYGDYYQEFLSYNNNDKKLEVLTKLSNGVSNYLITSYSEIFETDTLGAGTITPVYESALTFKKSNNKPVQIHSVLSYNDYNPQKQPTILLTNRAPELTIKDYDVTKTNNFKPFILFNDRDPRIFTNISRRSIARGYSYSSTYSTYQISTGRVSVMPYDAQSGCGLFPTLTNYDRNNNSLLFDFRNGNPTLDAASQSLYQAYYSDELDNINGLFIIDTEIDMNMSEFNEFTFAQLWKLKIQGEYKLFRINKMNDFTFNDDSMTKVQLVEIPNPLKWFGLTASFQKSTFGPSF